MGRVNELKKESNTPYNKLAKAISYLFSAPLFALYSTIIIVLEANKEIQPLPPHTAILVGFIFLTFLPLLPIILGSLRGHVDLFVSEREKRPLYFAFAILSYTLGAVTCHLIGSRLFLIINVSYLITTISMTIATLKLKVSVHLAGVTGPATYITYFLGPKNLPLYLVAIPVAWARIKLGAHTPREALLGATISIITTITTIHTLNTLLPP